MRELHLLSYFCPFFSVHDLDQCLSVAREDVSISESLLEELNLLRVKAYFRKHHSLWVKAKKDFEIALNHPSTKILYWGHPAYPERLKNLGHPPALLFCRGEASLLNSGRNVSIVGARHPTHMGRLWVRQVVNDLKGQEIVFVSGGARGIDEEVHWAAVNCGSQTIAFLPGGVDRPYPLGNLGMFEQMIEKKGAIISEYPSRTVVRPENFHRRNRLIAGCADVVVIVEAGEKSGTLMTARSAIREHVDLLIVPGSPLIETYKGSLSLLWEGAEMARDAGDILNLLATKKTLKNKEESPTVKS